LVWGGVGRCFSMAAIHVCLYEAGVKASLRRGGERRGPQAQNTGLTLRGASIPTNEGKGRGPTMGSSQN